MGLLDVEKHGMHNVCNGLETTQGDFLEEALRWLLGEMILDLAPEIGRRWTCFPTIHSISGQKASHTYSSRLQTKL